MPATLFVVIIATCSVVALSIHAARQRYGPNPLPEGGIPAAEIIYRVEREPWTCHHAPARPYTVEQASRVMQERINCSADDCDAKAAAFRVLVDARRIKPATWSR